MIGKNMKALLWSSGVLFCVVAACTKDQPKCKADSDCTNPAYPFCDVNGEFAAAGGEKNVCTIVPPDCPVERCGCSPGAARCDGDSLVTCDSGGLSNSTTACPLGCNGSAAQCSGLEPLNGLAPALASAGSAADIDLQDGYFVNTDTGDVTTVGNVLVDVPSIVITQPNGPIRAFYGHAIHVGNVKVQGTEALALVAATDLTVDGRLDASAANNASGPGAVTTQNACVGASSAQGGGGGGNATAGGVGEFGAGGTVQGALDNIGLVGGCNGGPQQDSSGNPTAPGGGGGGGVELLAGSTVTIGAAGVVSLGGGGGPSAAGGGSGGNLVIESPVVRFSMARRLSRTAAAVGRAGTRERMHISMQLRHWVQDHVAIVRLSTTAGTVERRPTHQETAR